MALWNEQTVFRFSSVPTYRDPCSSLLDMNGVDFSDTLCGEDWGTKTLAVATTWSIYGKTTRTNIVFDGTREWDVYSGAGGGDTVDFRRVAVHELGHALGLGHEEDSPSIMAPRYGDIEAPQADDIAGVTALYVDNTPPGEDPPPNDLFSNALTISGARGSTTGSNVAATVEPGEPSWGQSSVWWQWRPASSGTVTIDTVGSTFEADLGVYTGTLVSALRRLERDSAAVGEQSRVTLAVAAGTTYKLRVSNYGVTGDIVLNWDLEIAPPNDLFSNALTISGARGSTTGSNAAATVEPGEPGGSGRPSVWWQWRPASSGTVTIDTVGSAVAMDLGVYTGTIVSALRSLEQDYAYGGEQSRVTLAVAAGITYKLRVSSYSYRGWGDIVLNWNLEAASDPPPPNNDDAYLSLIFPQVADGSFSDGTFFRTTIALANERSDVVNCHLILYGMDADFGAGRGSSFPLSVPAYGVMSVRTTGAGRLQSGYATVGCDDYGISGHLTYATYDAFGTKTAEATVFPTEYESFRYSIIVDGGGGARLGLAIANNTDLSGTYDLTLWDQAGFMAGEGSATVPPRSNSARFLDELISPPPASGSVYLLEIESSDWSQFSMIGIRVTGSVFSTVPAQ